MGRETFHKRQREKRRDERKAAKRERREAAKRERREAVELADGTGSPDAPDETALMERFRLLSERHAAGEVNEEAYAAERRDIFSALGLDATE